MKYHVQFSIPPFHRSSLVNLQVCVSTLLECPRSSSAHALRVLTLFECPRSSSAHALRVHCDPQYTLEKSEIKCEVRRCRSAKCEDSARESSKKLKWGILLRPASVIFA
jgi:hypothetical protein